MNIPKKILVLALVVLALAESCQKAQLQRYSSTDNIYFNFSDTADDRDSMVYTFAYTPGRLTDTLWLPVQVSGNRVNKARQFKVAVTDSGTTAVAGLDYVPLLDSYTLPGDSGTAFIPLILLNKDSALAQRSVALDLHLVTTSDLGTQLADIVSARIIWSNKLQKPGWWDLWLSDYSDVKFELFIIATGVNTLASGPDYGLFAPQSLYYIGLLDNLLADPVTWLANNTDKGYVLQVRGDGKYDFYNTATPNTKILVIHDSSTGNYFFIDENGGYVTPN